MTNLATAPVSTRARRISTEAAERHGRSPLEIIRQWKTDGALERLATGWPTFDAATRGGPVLGRLMLILGAPNAYKTALLAWLAWRWLHEGVAVGVLCVDEDVDDFVTRAAVMSGVSLDDAEKRAPATLLVLEKALAALPLKLYGPEWTIEAAAADLHAFMKARGIKHGAFLADSLQTITCDASLDASSLRVFVGANVTALARAATRHRLAVLATGEIPRAAYDARSNDMAATKESGAGEYAAKIQCVLRRAKRNDSLVHVSIPKIKRGLKDETEFFLRFDRARHTLTEDAAVPGTAGTDPLLRARILEVIGSRELTSATAVAKAIGGKKQIALAAVKTMVRERSLVVEDGVFRAGGST